MQINGLSSKELHITLDNGTNVVVSDDGVQIDGVAAVAATDTPASAPTAPATDAGAPADTAAAPTA